MSVVLENGIKIEFETKEEFIIKLVQLLNNLDWSDRKLARESKIEHSTVTRILSGKTKNPSIETLTAMLIAIAKIKVYNGGDLDANKIAI
ncbi:helix-turn-helix domain-containing protein [Clostridium sp.]|uniref:helix-turn-helix domain-containing protein n=1 Tax=Clostridium sp. TaxID=1506 RepID=UPI002FC68C64